MKIAYPLLVLLRVIPSSGCPAAPPEKTFDWKLEDPSGKPMEFYRQIRDEIEARVTDLLLEIEER